MRRLALPLLALLALPGCSASSGLQADRQRAAALQAEATALLARADSLGAVPGAPNSLTPADSAWLARVPTRFDSLQTEYAVLHREGARRSGRWPLSTTLLISGALLAATLFFYAVNPANFE